MANAIKYTNRDVSHSEDVIMALNLPYLVCGVSYYSDLRIFDLNRSLCCANSSINLEYHDQGVCHALTIASGLPAPILL